MDLALICELAPPGRRKSWTAAIAVKLVVFAGLALLHPKFVVVIAAYGLSLLAWAAAATLANRSWRPAMLAAIVLSVVGAVVQQMRWAPSPHFNHNDLYHVFQALALVGFYRAARAMGQHPQSS